MLQLITAIAMWCGIQSSGEYQTHRRTVSEVNTCRERILECMREPGGKIAVDRYSCFMKEKLR